MEQELHVDTKKTAILVIGMAGSGKTTFIQRLSQTILRKDADPCVIMNLDPAVQFTPYTPDIDIRKKIDYKKLMQLHQLGPNGAIMTSLNLYSTQIDEVMNEYQSCKNLSDYFVVDTPGQIEVFTWSASGSIFSQTISSMLPTVIVYVLDIARCQDPNSFVSNMLFCLSIFYKMRLPFLIVFNKEDISDKQVLMDWMQDYEKLLEALRNQDSYLSTLSKSMVLSLDEFYTEMNYIAVSSITGKGFDELLKKIDLVRKDYFEITLPDIQKNYKQVIQKEIAKQQQEIERFNKDQKELEEQRKKQGPQYIPQMSVQYIGGQDHGQQQKPIKSILKQEKSNEEYKEDIKMTEDKQVTNELNQMQIEESNSQV